VVPFVRVTRDKRGYEHIYLMQASGRRGKGAAPRTLYVFRTPPGVKVGREPFDETVRRTIEDQNPGVYFDWNKLSVIMPPAPDVEYWRERRRVQKAAKQAQRQEEREEAAARDTASLAGSASAPEEEDADEALDREMPGEPGEDGVDGPEAIAEGPAAVEAAPAAAPVSGQPADASGHRRRRRRRGGRGRRRHPQTDGSAQVPADSPKVVDDSTKER
jgi:hypothetical protein